MADLFAPAEELLRRLPLPLAQLYRRAHNAKTPRDSHDFAFYLWEAALKLLAASAAVSYRSDSLTDPKIAAALANLARPSLGHWCEIARRLIPVLAQWQVAGYLAVDEIIYGRPRNDLPRCAGLMAASDFALGKGGGPKANVQVGDLLDKLVEYRNKTSGHGAPAARTSEMLRGLADALMMAAGELFVRVDVLAGRRLMYVAEVRPIRGSWLIERVELVGVAPWRVASLEVSRSEGQPPPAETGVYLADPAAPNDLAAMTRLHPFVAYEPESESVLFLNSRRGGRRTELLCYTSGRTVDLPDAGGTTSDGDAEPAGEADSAIGRCIGEYKLLTELGRGAMGIVYRAWQPSLNREVAIKVQPRTGDAKADARFRREVRALGRVEHANLIKVHTSGSDGEYFYYTMELVEGAPLAAVSDALTHDGRTTVVDLPAFQEKVGAACAAAKAAEKPLSVSDKADPFQRRFDEKSRDLLSLPDLLLEARRGKGPALGRDLVRRLVTLLRQVAEAAHALHEAGILHRDIKPGNILVTADGNMAVLMDLGLAQLADDIEGRLTRTRQFVGTLRYASPQQVLAAGPLDRRADVYSLGATLWELLALRPLFGATEGTPTMALMEMIQRDDPERLGKINPSVDRDLEAVVHKCLDKSPQGRYASAQELVNDLGRWLDGNPVKARPVRGWERAWKWSRRRPLLSGLTAALVVAIVTGTVASWLLAAKAEREAAQARAERDVANEQKRRTRQALDMMVSDDMIERLGSQKELSKSQRQFLHKALDYYRDFAKDAPTDTEGRKLEADAHYRVGNLLRALGQTQEAIDSYRPALAAYTGLAADFPTEFEHRRAAGVCHNNIGNLLADLGRLEDAETERRAAVQSFEALVADAPTVPEYRRILATGHRNLGQLNRRLGRQAAAEAEARTGLSVADKLVAEFPSTAEYLTELASAHHDLGVLLVGLGRGSDGEPEYRAANAARKKLAEKFPDVALYRRELAAGHQNLGILLQDLGRRTAAEAEYRAALPIGEKLVNDFPALPDYRSLLAWTENNLGLLLASQGCWNEAETQHRAALALREKLVAEFPAMPDYRNELSATHNNLGVLFRESNRLAAAEPEYRSALAIREKLVADFPTVPAFRQDLAGSHANLGRLLDDTGRPAASETEYKSALAIQEKLAADFPKVPVYRSELALSRNNLGSVRLGQKRFAEAEAEYRAALAIRERLVAEAPAAPEFAVDLGGSLLNVGNVLYTAGDAKAALGWHAKAVDQLTPLVIGEPQRVTARRFLAYAHIARSQDLTVLKRFADVLVDLDSALKFDDGSYRIPLRFRRADCLARLGRSAEAVHETESLIVDPASPVYLVFGSACVASLASAVPDDTNANAHAARAVELLRRSVVKGFTDVPHMLANTDLAPLRKRADYAALLWDLADAPSTAVAAR
jgi:serine/threonine protein kinase/tetratricopeptide (TPR) repeat protein